MFSFKGTKKDSFLVRFVCLFLLISVSISFSVSPSYGALQQFPKIQNINIEYNDPTLVELWLQTVRKIMKAINDKIEDKERFIRLVKRFKRKLDSQLSNILGGFGRIIKKYANSKRGLVQSGNDFIFDLSRFTNGLWHKINQFPMLSELKKIVSPIFNVFVKTVQKKIPKPRPGDPDNPLAKFENFYEDMEKQNPYHIGPLFKKEPLKTGHKTESVRDRTQKTTTMGHRETNIVFRKIKKFSNDMLVFHKVIINNICRKIFVKQKDFSVLHGMPDAMRKDGADPRVISFVEELRNLANYYLVKAHRDKGLILDPNHPQLKIPHGYSPQQFVKNFTRLIHNWQNKTYDSLKSFEYHLREKLEFI